MSQAGRPTTHVLVHHPHLSGSCEKQPAAVNVQASGDSGPGSHGFVARDSHERRILEYERKLAGISYMAAGKEQDSLLWSKAHQLQYPSREVTMGANGKDRVRLGTSTPAQTGLDQQNILLLSEPSLDEPDKESHIVGQDQKAEKIVPAQVVRAEKERARCGVDGSLFD